MNTLTNSHWDVVVSLLRLDYPFIDRAKLQAMLGGGADEDEYITTKQACSMLKCSVQSLMRWSRAGRIARAKITPGKVLYSRNDIRRMLGDGR